jgi:cystathionine beta-synthase
VSFDSPPAGKFLVVVAPGDLLVTACSCMKLCDVFQPAVMEGDAIVGILDESDILMHVYADGIRLRDPVSTAMVSRLEKLVVKSPNQSLLPC